MAKDLKALVSMVNVTLQGRVLKQEQIAKIHQLSSKTYKIIPICFLEQ